MSILDERITLMCAMRYALGRMTYVVSSVTSELIRNWHIFSNSDQVVILKEIREALEKEEAGMECDEKRWIAVINHAISSQKTSNLSEEKNE